MAEIVLAYCASHAPMMSAARESAPEEQRTNFFGALDEIRQQAVDREVQACVVLSNEHFTNFFLEKFPQICIGLGERNWGPTEAWLPIDKVWIPGAGGLSHWIGTPRIGDIEEEFDRWFLDRLEQGAVDELLDLPHDEIELAGNGAHEIRSWRAVAGAAAPARARTLAYEPVYPWITGMAVSRFEAAKR